MKAKTAFLLFSAGLFGIILTVATVIKYTTDWLASMPAGAILLSGLIILTITWLYLSAWLVENTTNKPKRKYS